MTYVKKTDEERREETKKMLELQKSILSNEEYMAIVQKYNRGEPDEKLTGKKHAVIMGAARNLLFDLINGGASPEEVKLGIINSMVCMDARKYNLDWARWKRDNDIATLVNKYHKKKA